MEEDLFDELLKINSNFRKFVDEQKEKTTEQIAEEFGIDLKAIRENDLI